MTLPKVPWVHLAQGIGVFAMSCVAVAAWFAGLPLLGHPLSVEWLVLGGAVTAALVWMISALWNQRTSSGRAGLLIGPALAVVFAAIGSLANPVVIDGVVYAKGSETYSQVTYANAVVRDLQELKGMDTYLTGSKAETWAQSSEIQRAQIQAQEMSSKYGLALQERTVPAGALLAPSQATMDAAYEMSEALSLRLKLLESGTEELDKDVAKRREAFAKAWQQAGVDLGAAATSLNIPLTISEGPRES